MEVHFITPNELVFPLKNKLKIQLLDLVHKVYDLESANLFYDEILEQNYDICYLTEDDKIIGLGCIIESCLSYGLYELSWGMIDPDYRGKHYGKVLIEERINHVKEKYNGWHSINEVLVVTKKPWHLERCGFKIISQLAEKEEVLMYLEIEK